MAHSVNVMKFTLDQPHTEVHSGEGVEVGDYLGLVTYYPGGRRSAMWNHWVEVLDVGEDFFMVQVMRPDGFVITSKKDRTDIHNKWVKMITTREYKVDQEPLEDEETL